MFVTVCTHSQRPKCQFQQWLALSFHSWRCIFKLWHMFHQSCHAIKHFVAIFLFPRQHQTLLHLSRRFTQTQDSSVPHSFSVNLWCSVAILCALERDTHSWSSGSKVNSMKWPLHSRSGHPRHCCLLRSFCSMTRHEMISAGIQGLDLLLWPIVCLHHSFYSHSQTF